MILIGEAPADECMATAVEGRCCSGASPVSGTGLACGARAWPPAAGWHTTDSTTTSSVRRPGEHTAVGGRDGFEDVGSGGQ